MSESIKSLILAIIGLLIVVTGICTDAGWQVIGLGAMCSVVSVAAIIYDRIKDKKNK